MGARRQRIGVLVRDGYQELEFWYPVLRFREADAEVTVIGAADERTYHSKLGYPVIPDVPLAAATADLDALIVPGASANDGVDRDVRRYLEKVAESGAVIGASSEGPRALAEAGLLRDRPAVGAASIAAALGAGGAKPASDAVVTEGAIVTARSADDLPAFFRAVSAALDRKA